eukprot:271320-Chlamydomonas_euryale.AAC.1
MQRSHAQLRAQHRRHARGAGARVRRPPAGRLRVRPHQQLRFVSACFATAAGRGCPGKHADSRLQRTSQRGHHDEVDACAGAAQHASKRRGLRLAHRSGCVRQVMHGRNVGDGGEG